MSRKREYNNFISAFMKEHVPVGSNPAVYRQALSDGAAAWRARSGGPVRENPTPKETKSRLLLLGLLGLGYLVARSQAANTAAAPKP